MISMRAFRSDPHFADLFAHVPVICWPILWWQLNALFTWCRREGIPDVLYSVNDWGLITVRYCGAAPDPAAYHPVPRIFRPLTDAGWSSDRPPELEECALSAALILTREADGCVLRSLGRSRKGALTARPDTS